ncbi:MAG TPA: class II aldolase/adducin family protein [Acidimicrobiales bacterium]|jgi:L-fuculose-phosphate aldolase|nr:class II aldolase/adducin family protein [Acidimicrobiales bacterium]
MTMKAQATRQAVLETAQALLRKGLVEGTSGNVSGRDPDGSVVLTPSSVPYDTMTLDDLVVCSLDGDVLDGVRGPTSEKALHLEVLRRYPEIGGVIHLHPIYATMFALIHEPIPAVIEEVVVYIGGDVPIAEYRTTGTDDLGAEAARHLGDRSAVLLANHGMVVVGKDPAEALHHAGVVERTAQIVWGARQVGEIVPIPQKVNDDFAGVYRLLRGI